MSRFSLLDPEILEKKKEDLIEIETQRFSKLTVNQPEPIPKKDPVFRAIVLDLNGVLVQKEYDPQQNLISKHWEEDGVFHVNNFFIRLRPGLKPFLKFCNKNFQLIIWSSAKKHNIERIIKELPDFKGIKLTILSQEDCLVNSNTVNEYPLFMKPLQLISEKFGFKKENIIILDDSEDKILLEDRENLMLIPPFTGDPEDNLLSEALLYIRGWMENGKIRYPTLERKN